MLRKYETYYPNLFFFLSTELAEMYCAMSAESWNSLIRKDIHY
jgi:hypothetical protein